MVISRTAFILQLVLIIALAWASVYLGRDEIRSLLGEQETQETPAPAAGVRADGDRGPEVRISPAVQGASGIETRALASHVLEPALPVQGRILDLAPLAASRSSVEAAAAAVNALRAAAERSRAEHRRVAALYEADRTASQRAVESTDAERIAAESRLADAEGRVTALDQQLRREWGPVIARWAMAPRSPELQRLLEGHEVLLMMILAPEHPAPRSPGALAFTVPGSSAELRHASAVSAAPRSDPALPGTTYFYRAESKGLRTGDRVTGRLALDGSPAEGVIVPESAVLWHGGLAWVYVQGAPDRFERRGISTGEPVGDGWFDAHLEPGARVVVRGAQLLLSEEFRGQITNENED